MSPIGESLISGRKAAKEEMLLCAPFIKLATLKRVLGDRAPVPLQVITRWRPEEVAAGVSDTAILGEVQARGGEVLLCERLHAKYYRFDSRALIGSANLTGAGLGWRARSNLELLIEIDAASETAVSFERLVMSASVPASEEIAAAVEAAAAKLSPLPHEEALEPEDDAPAESNAEFLPQLREPRDLFRAYDRGPHTLASASATASRFDLEVLAIPPGLDRETFYSVVGARLLQFPAFVRVDSMLDSQQRFGAIRDGLGAEFGLDRDTAARAWQTMMRWMLEFLPARYELAVPGHSELMQRRPS
jgi:hypothetical protein